MFDEIHLPKQDNKGQELGLVDDELIYQVARRLDPEAFDHGIGDPPMNFLGSLEWWEVAKNSRIKRAMEDAAKALGAVRSLGFAVLPRVATPAMLRTGVVPLGSIKTPRERKAMVSEVWSVMLSAAIPEPDVTPESEDAR